MWRNALEAFPTPRDLSRSIGTPRAGRSTAAAAAAAEGAAVAVLGTALELQKRCGGIAICSRAVVTHRVSLECILDCSSGQRLAAVPRLSHRWQTRPSRHNQTSEATQITRAPTHCMFHRSRTHAHLPISRRRIHLHHPLNHHLSLFPIPQYPLPSRSKRPFFSHAANTHTLRT